MDKTRIVGNKFKKKEPEKILLTKIKKKPIPYVLIGTLEELKAYLGIIKAQHGLFIEKINGFQNNLGKIISKLNTNKAEYFSDSDACIKQIDLDLEKIFSTTQEAKETREYPSLIEAQFLFARSVCKRAERQISGLDFKPEEIYLGKLGEYLSVIFSNMI